MKRVLWLAVLLALVIMALGVAGCEGITSPTPRAPSTSPVTGQNTGIWVTGRGEVTVTPDIAILEVGAEAQEATVSQAMAKTSDAMNKVMTALADSGVKNEDIQTQYFRIRQRTQRDAITNQDIVIGYQVTNTATAKIRDIEKVSRIIDDVVKAGGDLIRINDLNFSVDDPSKYYDEAREKATNDARDRAEKLAKQTGVKLGAPTYIAESASLPSPYESMAYGMSAVPAPAPVIIEAPVSPGEVKVILYVQVAYSIR